MKNNLFLRILSLTLLIGLLATNCACRSNEAPGGETTPPTNGKIDYSVSVLDVNGNLVNGVIVNILSDGKVLEMQVQTSQPLIFNLEKGTYSVELTFVSPTDAYHYDTAACVLDEANPSLQIVLTAKATPIDTVHAYSPKSGDYVDQPLYSAALGGTYIPLRAGDRTYVLFAPTVSGTYEIGFQGDAAGLTLAYYGGSVHFISPDSLSGEEAPVLTLDVQTGHIGGAWVLGINSETATECILSIKRTGNAATLDANQPWSPYLESDFSEFFADCENWKMTGYTPFDVTNASLRAVLNEADGFYHLNTADGPILYVALDTASPYLASFQDICDVTRMGAYIYDENGNLLVKESYNELFMQYDFATVPLTETLAHAIQKTGEANNWWDLSSPQTIFSDVAAALVVENAWLFACGYFTGETETLNVATANEPLSLKSSKPSYLRMEAGTTAHVTASISTAGTKILLSFLDDATGIVYNGKLYTPENGSIMLSPAEGDCSFTVTSANGTEPEFLKIELILPEA